MSHHIRLGSYFAWTLLVCLLGFQAAMVMAAKSNGNQRKVAENIDYEIWDLMDQSVSLFGQGRSWYEVFGVVETATTPEISKAYRRLSLQMHPDKNKKDKKADKKFQTISGMSRILRDEETRRQYDFWLESGIPYWRGKGYYFRKSENLSILQTTVVVFVGFSVMQYVAKWVKYFQVRSGLRLLEELRRRTSSSSTANTSTAGSSPATSYKWKTKKGKELAKRRKNDAETLSAGAPGLVRSESKQSLGLFDDANMKHALDWLVVTKHVHPDAVLDYSEWNSLIEEEGEDSVKLYMPSVTETAIVSIPKWAGRYIMSFVVKPTADDEVQDATPAE
jgi:curved DNA-binding protein CbpA